MVKVNSVSQFKFAHPVWMNFEYVTRGLRGSIKWPPRFCQHSINDFVFGVDPDDRQISPDEHHVNGCVDAAISPFDEQQTFVWMQAVAKSEPAQFAQKRPAPFCLDGSDGRVAQIS
jgi:hypothetical protein